MSKAVFGRTPQWGAAQLYANVQSAWAARADAHFVFISPLCGAQKD